MASISQVKTQLIRSLMKKMKTTITSNDLKMKRNLMDRRCHSGYNRLMLSKERTIKGPRVSIGVRHSMQRMG